MKRARRQLRIVTSAANFWKGEPLKLRAEDGGGRWVVVRVLRRAAHNFARAVIERTGT